VSHNFRKVEVRTLSKLIEKILDLTSSVIQHIEVDYPSKTQGSKFKESRNTESTKHASEIRFPSILYINSTTQSTKNVLMLLFLPGNSFRVYNIITA
jgi:hypothetical protein